MKLVSREARLERRKRLGRFSYALSGGIFLISAWDGATSSPPAAPLLIWTSVISGAIQLGVLAWSRSGEPPERLANGLAALGMFVSAIAAIHHKTGIQYAYTAAGLLYAALAVLGIEKIARVIKGRPAPAITATGSGDQEPVDG